jgi:hypothetical protein
MVGIPERIIARSHASGPEGWVERTQRGDARIVRRGEDDEEAAAHGRGDDVVVRLQPLGELRGAGTGETVTLELGARVADLHLRAQHEHAETLRDRRRDLGRQHREVAVRAPGEQESREQPPLGGAPPVPLRLADRERLHVVGELALQENGRVVPRDRDQRVMGEVGERCGRRRVRHVADVEAGRANDKYSERVEAVLAPSRCARAFVICAVIATLALVAVTPMASELRALSACWVAVAGLHALLRVRRPRSLLLDAAGRASVEGVEGRVRDGSFVAPWLTAIRWRPEGAWLDRALLVLPDMLDAEEFRRLRVILRLGK